MNSGADPRRGERGDDQGLANEPEMQTATLDQATQWRHVYADLLAEAMAIVEYIEREATGLSVAARAEVATSSEDRAARQVVRYRRRGQAWMARVDGLTVHMATTRPLPLA